MTTTLLCQTIDCPAPARYTVHWRTRAMRASASWRQCERCMAESVALLERDPTMQSVRVHQFAAPRARLFER